MAWWFPFGSVGPPFVMSSMLPNFWLGVGPEGFSLIDVVCCMLSDVVLTGGSNEEDTGVGTKNLGLEPVMVGLSDGTEVEWNKFVGFPPPWLKVSTYLSKPKERLVKIYMVRAFAAVQTYRISLSYITVLYIRQMINLSLVKFIVTSGFKGVLLCSKARLRALFGKTAPGCIKLCWLHKWRTFFGLGHPLFSGSCLCTYLCLGVQVIRFLCIAFTLFFYVLTSPLA